MPCAEALLGAAGLGDLGSLFPDTDPEWEGADSIEMLRTCGDARRRPGLDHRQRRLHRSCASDRSWHPDRDEMQRRLGDAVGAAVTVKGRRAEGLGAIGRVEGVACWAVAVIQRDAR